MEAQETTGMTFWSHWEATETAIWCCRESGSLWSMALERWWGYQEKCYNMKCPVLKEIEYAMLTL